jgi:hypothetical protein
MALAAGAADLAVQLEILKPAGGNIAAGGAVARSRTSGTPPVTGRDIGPVTIPVIAPDGE